MIQKERKGFVLSYRSPRPRPMVVRFIFLCTLDIIVPQPVLAAHLVIVPGCSASCTRDCVLAEVIQFLRTAAGLFFRMIRLGGRDVGRPGQRSAMLGQVSR
jgi:hypothetical protein